MFRIHSELAHERTPPADRWARVRFSALLATWVIGLIPGQTFAQEVNVPQSRNPYLGKIAHLYEEFEYESALQLIPKAEQHPSNKDQEVLWLELMRGILYYSLHDSQKSDTAFRFALKKAPFTSLPLLNPSQTLYEHFNALRQEVTQAGRIKPGTSQPQPSSPAAPSGASPNTTSDIPETALQEKLNALERRGREIAGGSLSPTIASPLEILRSHARKARTAQERMAIAKAADLWMDWVNRQQAAAPSLPASVGTSVPATKSQEAPVEPEKERSPRSISNEDLNDQTK